MVTVSVRQKLPTVWDRRGYSLIETKGPAYSEGQKGAVTCSLSETNGTTVWDRSSYKYSQSGTEGVTV